MLAARQNRSETRAGSALRVNAAIGQGHFDTFIGQGVRPLIAGVPGMAAHPTPVDLMPAIADHSVQTLPKINVFHRRLGSRAPATGLPAVNPLGDALEYVFAVQMHSDLAGPFQGGQGLDHSHDLHAVVGRAQLAAKNLFARPAGVQQRAPATGAGVAFAGAIGVDHDRRGGIWNFVHGKVNGLAGKVEDYEDEGVELFELVGRRLAIAAGAGARALRVFQPGSNKRMPRTRLLATKK